MLELPELGSQRRVLVELGLKLGRSGYHSAGDATPETQRRAVAELSSDFREWVLLAATATAERTTSRDWNCHLLSGERAAAEATKSASNRKWEVCLLSSAFRFPSSASYWQNLKGNQLAKNKVCFQGSSSGITKWNMRQWISSCENMA